MGLFKSLKGESGPSGIGGDSSAQAEHNVQSHNDYLSTTEKQRLFGNQVSSSSSLPPLQLQTQQSSQTSSSSKREQPYIPPPGPPPSNSEAQAHSDAPLSNPPPYHDWTSIPDTALLPPPPAFSSYNINSPTNNASYDAAARAHEWCDRFPVYTPSTPSPQIQDAVRRGAIALDRPREFAGELKKSHHGGAHTWRAKTTSQCPDAILISTLPSYFASTDSPLHTERPFTIYFELKVLGIKDRDSGIAIGFCAKPYPTWRLPGWHRASLGVHGDDGRRFVNDSWGGVDFVEPFRVGEVVGIGMKFHAPDANSVMGGRVKTEAVLARNGRKEGSWWLDEERDAERNEGVEGLQGELDMYAAVGVFGGVEFEIVFESDNFMYTPG